jgi:hypothetical protein
MDHRARIEQNIRSHINKFKNKEIDYNALVANIAGNMTSLDGLSKDLESAKHRVCGKLDIIHYTVDSDKEFEAMLKEVEIFENIFNKNI